MDKNEYEKLQEMASSFGFAKDELGNAVNDYVFSMAETEAELEQLYDNDGNTDMVSLALVGVHEAYLKMLDILLTCGKDAIKERILAYFKDKYDMSPDVDPKGVIEEGNAAARKEMSK